jgi:hypothetical protein
MTEKPRAPALATRCRRCRKPIVWPGLCYTCATGLPRLILRSDERLRVAELSELGDITEIGEIAADQCFPLEDVPSSSLVS